MSDYEESESKRCKLTLQNYMDILNEYLLEYIFSFIKRKEQEATLLFVCSRIRKFFLPKMPLTKCMETIEFADNVSWLEWQLRCYPSPRRLGQLFRLCMEKELDDCVQRLLRENCNLDFTTKEPCCPDASMICTCSLIGLIDSTRRHIILSRSYISDFYKRIAGHNAYVCGRMLYMLAVRNNDITIMKVLEDQKLRGHHRKEHPFFQANHSIRCGIRWACRCGHLEALQFLLNQWEIRDIFQSERDQYVAGLNHGLCWASRQGNQKFVEILLGCPETDLSFHNNYALKIALRRNNKGIFELLSHDRRVKISTVLRIVIEYEKQTKVL